MSMPTIESTDYQKLLFYNLERLTSLLDNPVATPESHLVPDPDSYYFSIDGEWDACIYKVKWWWKGSEAAMQMRQSHLAVSMNATRELLFQAMNKIVELQSEYSRHLKNFIYDRTFVTEDLADTRACLLTFYRELIPFIKQAKRTQGSLVERLLGAEPVIEITSGSSVSPPVSSSISQPPIIQRSRVEQLFGTGFSSAGTSSSSSSFAASSSISEPEYYRGRINRKIAALIELECICGNLFPYKSILPTSLDSIGERIFSRDDLETINYLVKSVFPLVDMKIIYRGLTHIFSVWEPTKMNADFGLYLLLENYIPIFQFPDRKQDTYRRSLQEHSVARLSPTRSVMLAERLSSIKEGWDERIIFRLEEPADCVIIFYANRYYSHFFQWRQANEWLLYPGVTPIEVDRKGRWSIEPYISHVPLESPVFFELVSECLRNGPLAYIDFRVMICHEQGEFITLKHLYRFGNDLAAFIEGLVDYYEVGYYKKKYPTLYLFLDTFLEAMRPEDKSFFSKLARRVFDLPRSATKMEIQEVIDTGVARQKLISNSIPGCERMSPDRFEKRCGELVHAVYNKRNAFISTLDRDGAQIRIKEYRQTLIKQVRAWFLPD